MIEVIMIFPAKEIEGYKIQARDGVLGSAKDLYFDDQKWVIRYFTVDLGGLLKSRRVLLSAPVLSAISATSGMLAIDATSEQVRNSPPLELDRPVSRQHERALHDFFGWPYYWSTSSSAGSGVAPEPSTSLAPSSLGHSPDAFPAAGATDTVAGDPHLRSVREVRGYKIAARDGDIGEVDDFLVDDAQWQIRHLLVDTRKWLPGRRVLVAPDWIHEVNWSDSAVEVDLTRDQIEQAPAYDATMPLSEEYDDRLFQHYGRQRRR